jgi:hypothetical protein
MIRCNRRVVRETSVIDECSRRAVVIMIEQGGAIVRVRLKGTRKWYAVPLREIWLMGARIEAQAVRQRKAEAREERRERKRR